MSDVSDMARPRLLVLTGGKGGTGKTTLARNLAAAAAREGLAVAVLDTDEQRTLSRWHQRRPSNAPAIIAQACPLAEAPATLRDLLTGAYRLVIVDTPPALTDHAGAVQALLLAADLVLIPAGPSIDDLESVVEVMHYATGELGRAGLFVLNGADRSRDTADARHELGGVGDVAARDVRRLADFRRTAMDGLGVIEVAGEAAKDIAALWAEVRRRLGIRP